MAIQTAAAATALLKQVYGPKIRDQLNNETLLFGLLKRVGKEQWGGSGFIEGLRTGRNRSTAPGSEAGDIPAAGNQTYNNFTIGCRQYHGTGGVSAFGAASTEMNAGGFEQMFRSEVDGLIADAKKDLNVDFYLLPTAVLGRLSANPASGAAPADVTVTLEQTQALDVISSLGTRYLSAGSPMSFMIPGTGGIRAGVTDVVTEAASITATDRTTFSCSGVADAVTTNDLLVRGLAQGAQGGTVSAATQVALNGLEHLIDDTTTMAADASAGNIDLDILQGINRTTAGNSFAHGTVLDKAGAALTESDLQNLVYQVEERSGMYPDCFLTHRSVQGAIQQLLVGDRRFVPQSFPGGFKADALVYNAGDADIPIIVDRECPYDRLYSLNLDALKSYVLRDIEMIEEDGSVLRQSGNTDQWQFSFRMFANLGAVQPNALGKMVRIGGADEAFGIGAARLYDF